MHGVADKFGNRHSAKYLGSRVRALTPYTPGPYKG